MYLSIYDMTVTVVAVVAVAMVAGVVAVPVAVSFYLSISLCSCML
jgi:hypothetical protein